MCGIGGNNSMKADQTEGDHPVKYVFWFAQILNGMGNTPLTVLAVVYMNENVNDKFYSVCLGEFSLLLFFLIQTNLG